VRDLKPLAGLTALEELFLGQTPVTDLTPLAGLVRLRLLQLSGTRVSDDQVAELRRMLPALE
jgi:internalin A